MEVSALIKSTIITRQSSDVLQDMEKIHLLDCKPTFFSSYFSLLLSASWLKIAVIHKGLILQLSFTGQACELYSIARG
jgi:hypothetical protein